MKLYSTCLLALVFTAFCLLAGCSTSGQGIAEAAPQKFSQATVASKLPCVPAEPSKTDIRNGKIVAIISEFVSDKDELKFNYDRPVEKDLDKFAQNVRYVYDITKSLDSLIKDMEVNQFGEHEVGFTIKDIKKVKRVVLQMTLQMTGEFKQRGYADTCLYEGGCFSTKDEVIDVMKKINKEISDIG